MTGSCHRCGSCCSSIPLLIKGMSPDYLRYLSTRGLKEDQGFILIPHECQHLKFQTLHHWDPITKAIIIAGPHDKEKYPTEESIPDNEWVDGTSTHEPMRCVCDIHDSPDRPACCVKYHGQKIIKKMIIYRPPGCGYLEDKV